MKKVVYILDDDEAIRETVSQFVKILGYEVHSFSNPSYCMVYLKSKSNRINSLPCADIIITDINMPEMSGLKFLELQKNMGCKSENMAVMSATWTEEEKREAVKKGYKIFEKPFDLHDLQVWIEQCVSNDVKLSPDLTNSITPLALNKVEKTKSLHALD